MHTKLRAALGATFLHTTESLEGDFYIFYDLKKNKEYRELLELERGWCVEHVNDWVKYCMMIKVC